MPRSDELTPEQKEKFANHLRAGMKCACPVCDARKWTVGPMVWVGDAIPLATLMCEQCYFVASFGAVPLGLIGS